MSAAYLQFVVSGLSMGSIYALVALGLTLGANTSGLVNFAHGQTVMVGGLVAYTVLQRLGWSWPAAFAASVVVATGLGWLTFRLASLRPRQVYEYTPVLLTLAFGTVLQGLALLLWGKDPVRLPYMIPGGSLMVAGAAVQPQALLVMAASLLLALLIIVFLRRTYLGKAMLATAENPAAAELVGLDSDRIVLLALVAASILGAVAGALIAPITLMGFQDGDTFLLKGMSAWMLGGMTSMGGAVVGGLIIGLTESLAAGTIDALFKDTVSLVIMILILFLKPSGLFSKS